ncbi:MAG: A/G-specific adenine glycosylase [Pseudomonadota bacterium]
MPGALLEWYDRNARLLPWRISPADRRKGVWPDPYRVWLSEIMLQQTTVAAVGPYFAEFTSIWPQVQDLAAADLDDVLRAWAGLGYYARARNLHRCAKHVTDEHGGRFPESEAGLMALPGVGPYTAAAIAAIAFDRSAVVVDGNVERVISRVFNIETPLPDSKPEIKKAAASLTPASRPGDYAQAVMDLGATICTPRRPACGICPWMADCAARRIGEPEALPKKKPKTAKPTRLGVAYLCCDAAGRVLLRRRPEKGLLGGMFGLPGTTWTEASPTADALRLAEPLDAEWRDLGVEARHTFTHFHLRLSLRGAVVAEPPSRDGDLWASRDELYDQALPTLMKKALSLGLQAMDA